VSSFTSGLPHWLATVLILLVCTSSSDATPLRNNRLQELQAAAMMEFLFMCAYEHVFQLLLAVSAVWSLALLIDLKMDEICKI
jgi:hypothetical protein